MKELPWNEITKAEFIYAHEGTLARHNYLCAVCKEESAVLDLSTGILQPCWECKSNGYEVVKLNWFLKLFIKEN